MMCKRQGIQRISAFIFLLVFGVETFQPGLAYALTSGPSQPEMQKFEVAGANDMVDLFTGDFKNNIPLMDVGGYPINISYQSGTGMEDEASWVGVGWSLNPGSVNRMMRGLPDDFNGETIQKHLEMKKFVKVGGTVSLKGSLFAFEVGKASMDLNIYKDNYYGMGASVGASLSASMGRNSATPLTVGMGVSINSDVRNGLTITPSLNLSQTFSENWDNMVGGLSGGLTYNTRTGLKDLTLSASFSTKSDKKNEPSSITTSSIHYFGQSHTPSIPYDENVKGMSFAFDVGPTFGAYGGGGGRGYLQTREVKNNDVSANGYGFLHYLNGRSNVDALLDYNREKEGVFITSAPAIPVPVATADFFTASGQAGSQQFRPYFAGNYVVFDKARHSRTDEGSVGLTLGAGGIFKAGGRVEYTNESAFAKKWRKEDGNQFLSKAEASMPLDPSVDPLGEPVYFKQAGEHTRSDAAFRDSVYGELTQAVDLRTVGSVIPQYRSGSSGLSRVKNVVKTKREARNFGFSYLTAAQASQYGLDKTINGQPRVGGAKKENHISEVTVTANDGKRMVYGIPVYNLSQREVSFANRKLSTVEQMAAKKSGLVGYSMAGAYPKHNFGRDEYLSAENMPGYATSFLLTGMLSPDYVDVTHDGITDDDLGTAVKFGYTKLSGSYRWRSPYGNLQANYSEGLLSDPKDDKASYVYGEKEIWYLNTVESKTMIAIFHTSNREDALGVSGETGGGSTAVKQKKLDSICLYSKSDWLAHSTAAAPVKVVHFEYDYSLYPGVPNNSQAPVMSPQGTDLNAAHGKLTLRRIYFTFGKNQRGQSNPYEFFYDQRMASDLGLSLPLNPSPTDPEANETYTTQQTDRWGSYKPSFYNAAVVGSSKALSNPEFPYAVQNNPGLPYGANDLKKLSDHFVSKWQLNRIITPTGSIIDVEYESDDYAFVQNKHAMQMVGIQDLVSSEGKSRAFADKFVVKLPVAVSSDDELRSKYLDGVDNLFFKVLTDLDNTGHQEYVYGYASVNKGACSVDASNHNIAYIRVNPVEGYGPVAKAAWQKLRVELPQYAYDNYDNSDVSSDFMAAVRSIISSVGNLRELTQPFDKKAEGRGFASNIDFAKSMIRLNNPDGHKLGGGSRVAKLTISDNWTEMTANANARTASFGQRYTYTIKNNEGATISSGVASYEPQIGNEENPFHEPVNFTEKVHWGLDKYHFIEKPFCETYFPAAQVGYSKVTVTPIGDDYNEGNTNPTGYTENEFYTAKDFPVVVDYTSLQQQQWGTNPILSLFASVTRENLMTSQGFKVEINDMHGKPKSVKTYSKGGDLLASSEYFYGTDDQNNEVKRLNNQVDILEDGNIVNNATVATDIDLVTDARMHHSETLGVSVGAYVGSMPFFLIPSFYGAVQVKSSVQTDTYKSSSYVKVVHKFGILKRVRTMQNGSTTEAENLLWDGLTGEVLLTRTQNAFNDYIYNFHYPAHMARDYDGMGAAYKNLGAVFNIAFSGTSISGTGSNYLVPGDELINLDVSVPQRAWVMNNGTTDFPSLHLIDEYGDFVTTPGTYQVVRSGRRNLLNASAGTIVCAKDPRVGNQLDFSAGSKIINAAAVQYNQDWAMPVPNLEGMVPACGEGSQLSEDGTSCLVDIPATQPGTAYAVCKTEQNAAYSACGTMIYSSFNANSSQFSRSSISGTNPFWIGAPGDQGNCVVPPPTTMPSQGWSRTNTDIHGNSNTAYLSGPSSGEAFEETSPGSAMATGNYGPLNRCGVWICPGATLAPADKWIGFAKKISVPLSKTYYVGIAARNNFRIKVDGVLKVQSASGTDENYKVWHVFPVTLNRGIHIIEMEGQNTADTGVLGAEIYNCSEADLRNATNESGLNIVFSTKDMVGQYFQLGAYSCPEGYALNTSVSPYVCTQISPLIAAPGCIDPVGQKINPYVKGIKGNWRPQKNYVYTVSREQKPGNINQSGGTNIRRSGTFSSFTPFWAIGAGGITNNLSADVTGRWVWSNASIYFDHQGNEIENVDALGRYGSALFGYQSTLATAVAANARHNEVMFDGFEDYGFTSQPVTQNCPALKHFDWHISKQGNSFVDNAGNYLDASLSHSGKYSFRVSSPVTITQATGNSQPSSTPILSFDSYGRYMLNTNELAKGFAPVGGKRQVVSMWVHDGSENTNTIQNLVIKINNIDCNIASKIVPVVEGWKRLEFVFDSLPVSATQFVLSLQPSAAVHIDDIRIMPYDAEVKTFVYDEYNLRLLGQLDENNFATFYEYDDEGTLIRVKKETDRGIMTLKETRKAYRKRN